ncbi:hypothetical protein BJ875DRAFT_489683 [Amylocarpus encephaloides]|uniref:ZZ-type domain-containing protein n=1 Tax=Amylocarpus encephaloides TaxID=45428 RepID=A0A9P7Y847_9HELO|nr:hypothetical protein BJ875DRAFT_489683 [Amylocarpus encephaloides]
MASTTATNPDTLVALKVNIEGSNRRFKLPLRDLGASTLPDKLRFLLAIPPTSEAVFERYSDSAAAFVVLDPANTSVYKQLYRAAKAKLKLRLKVTVKDKEPVQPKPASVEDEESAPVSPVEAEEATTQLAPIPPAPASPSVTYPEAPSVDEIQREMDQLIINQSRHYTTTVSGAHTSSIPPLAAALTCYPRVASSCPRTVVENQDASSLIPLIPTGRDNWFAELAGVSQAHQSALKNSTDARLSPHNIFSVYCNDCGNAIPDEHYHCSTCDDGDFDLCQNCVDDGVVCGGAGHWMIKRFVKNGKVINSVTERLAPKPKAPLTSESKATLVEEAKIPLATRTCNCCIAELSEEHFVACTSCDDYDLCVRCHVSNEHGHHPSHAFAPAVEDTNLGSIARALLAPGRNVGHNAVCDGCDKYIYGVRHKCLNCPDWDFCSTCMPNASFIHPTHRFVPIYEPLNDLTAIHRSYNSKARHHGIYCDGPLCSNGTQNPSCATYITGDRFKCAVCHDLDFCASCEASPSNPHNKTHPLIKFKTPVRNVNVTTLGDHEDGMPMPVMGDRRTRTHKATETTQAQSANAATQVQTIADLQPTEIVKPEETHEVEAPKSEPKVEEVEEVKELPAPSEELVAFFVRDVIADGTRFPPNCVFEQTWYMRNAGETSWPAGCSVKFVGGDSMCAIDPAHPASVHELVSASESTICYTEVAPGHEVGFTVLMRTPPRDGNFISYWRLTGPTGEKFGHRLWCDVSVKESVVKEEAKPDAKEEVVEAEAESKGSQMIFPKLEDTHASSVHQEAPAAAEEADDFDDLVEDVHDETDETDDGFLTDEEYDILDGSDEEYFAEQGEAAAQK